MTPSDTLVPLRPGPAGGLTVPLEALRLLWDLEARRFTLTPLSSGRLTVKSTEDGVVLTAADRAAVAKWKPHLLALVAYVPPEAA